MSTNFEVDQFASPQAWNEFGRRYLAIDETVEALDLRGVNNSENPALIFGGGALARYFLDSHVPNSKPFDLDVIVSNEMFHRLEHADLIENPARFFKNGSHGVIRSKGALPLSVDVISSEDPDELRGIVGDEPYIGEPNHSVREMDGLYVLWPGVVAHQKVRYQGSRIKDLAGVIKAHVVATHKEHPILGDPQWTQAVSQAVDRLADGRVQTTALRRITKRGPNYPSWLRQLIQADFEHPAFADIPAFEG